MLNLRQLVDDFFLFVQSKSIEIYNEFSLQHELGIFLREKLTNEIMQIKKRLILTLRKVVQ
ncbi:hypothetical protein K0H71_07775 [Bacillus sp. IITD106]|nr:hypothetical protein [Bacillus sp. IITD106]